MSPPTAPPPPLQEELSPSRQSTVTKKLYQAWPARSHPLCFGTVVVGVHWMNLLFNVLLTLALVVLFAVYTAYDVHWALVIVVGILTLITELFLMAAALSDPGIVPRQVQDVEEERRRKAYEDERDHRITNTARQALGMALNPAISTTPSSSLPYAVPTQRVRSINSSTGQPTVTDVPLKYCTTCHIYRPYSASHCRDCDQCVLAFDHHCPWISNCVGERNHRYFVGYIFSLTVLAVYVFVVSLYTLIAAAIDGALSDNLGSYIVAIVEVVFTFVTGWCFVSLSVYHCYLIAENTTTSQHIKQQREERSKHAKLALERHQQYARKVRGEPEPQPTAEEAVVGVTSGSAFTEGTKDEQEEKGERPVAVDGEPKRYLYPEVDAMVASSSVLHACWSFFCSPLPPSRVDMQSEVTVDDKGRILAYHNNSTP